MTRGQHGRDTGFFNWCVGTSKLLGQVKSISPCAPFTLCKHMIMPAVYQCLYINDVCNKSDLNASRGQSSMSNALPMLCCSFINGRLFSRVLKIVLQLVATVLPVAIQKYKNLCHRGKIFSTPSWFDIHNQACSWRFSIGSDEYEQVLNPYSVFCKLWVEPTSPEQMPPL